MTDTPPTNTDPATRSPAWLLWPALIVALLSLQILICFVAISAAIGMPGSKVVPDYYEKAVHWDQTRPPPPPPPPGSFPRAPESVCAARGETSGGGCLF